MDTKPRILYEPDNVDIIYSGNKFTEVELDALAKKLEPVKRFCPLSCYLSAEVVDDINNETINIKMASSNVTFTHSAVAPTLNEAADKAVDALYVQIQKWRANRFSLVGESRVLIIDDDPDSATLLEICFQKLGYQTHVMNSGLEVIKNFKEIPGHYCLVVVDIRMPLLDGKSTILGLEQLVDQSSKPESWREHKMPLVTFSVLPAEQIEFPTEFRYFQYLGHIPKGLAYAKLEKSVKKIAQKINEGGEK